MKTSKKQKNTGKTTSKSKPVSTVDYMDYLLKELRDPKIAAEYLTDAFEGGEATFLLAVRDVVQAQGGMSALAEGTKLNRENLYDMLSMKGNPRLSSITTLLNHLGITMQFAVRGS